MDVKLGLIQKQSTTKSMLLKCGATEECREYSFLVGLLIPQTLMYYYLKQPEKQKVVLCGTHMRSTSGHYDTLLTTIEGRLEGKRGRGRLRRTWVDDKREWTGSNRYDQIKRAESRHTVDLIKAENSRHTGIVDYASTIVEICTYGVLRMALLAVSSFFSSVSLSRICGNV